MADMIKFYKGLEANLPASGVNGALYITTDEGAIYLGTGTGMKRLGDFIQVAKVADLPEKAHENCLYYCVAENILAKWNGTEWKQINKQPTADELKTLLGLGELAYLSKVAESNLAEELATKINNKVDKNGTDRLITEAEAAKLELLVIDEETGQAAISGTVNANQVQGLSDLLSKKVDSVTAGDASIEIAGTKNDPTVAVQISAVEGNALELAEDGLKVIIPDSTKVEASDTPGDGTIKVDGQSVTVYTHPDKHAMTDITGLETALAGKQDVIAENTYDTYGSAAQALTDAKDYVDTQDVFETDMNTINSLGGIGANVNLNGLTTHEVLKKLLYPYVDATVGNATASPNGGTYEKGATKTITSVSISITKKSEPITKVALYNGGTLIEEKTGDAVKNGGTITFSGLSVEVPTNGNQLTVKVTYPDANGKAKTVEKKTTALTFVYPYYMGTCAAGTAIDETLVESLTKKIEGKGNKSNSFTVSDGHMVFAYLKSHGALKSIIDPNNFETIGNYTRSEVSVTGLDGTAQTYYVYVSGATTVSGFTVNFKY